jgi:hypothetical protein
MTQNRSAAKWGEVGAGADLSNSHADATARKCGDGVARAAKAANMFRPPLFTAVLPFREAR